MVRQPVRPVSLRHVRHCCCLQCRHCLLRRSTELRAHPETHTLKDGWHTCGPARALAGSGSAGAAAGTSAAARLTSDRSRHCICSKPSASGSSSSSLRPPPPSGAPPPPPSPARQVARSNMSQREHIQQVPLGFYGSEHRSHIAVACGGSVVPLPIRGHGRFD